MSMCDYGKLGERPCTNNAQVLTVINGKHVKLCPTHAGLMIENLVKSTGLGTIEQNDLLVEIIYGEVTF
jgi:hypothetical protein